ncbi:hypothetical protein EN885_07665 [Mesorhizobium sp. M6A.T.Cr.TU.014.01.1.1]|nr:hypothetical protein EOC94_16725 [Mesorhizobium sp. M6A.T.Ce.TU.016.01.1.1]RUU40060.1 hypothetical protein EOD08_14675 [Mesorhizobium sp. M6A.T.Ca.TU.002.02.2.1]RVB79109.1 hypothetical protein EN885_07665 [Mesorhizobium sp. M6A.T.Cr.TU.014.01.1.1]RWQ10057.1 MAG: hypothetical protein EOR90_06430 [Mesorhizobium sp.]RWQ11231.1 MAG: hypothetical protein EOR91_03450 [Mesorhizobium sp.]
MHRLDARPRSSPCRLGRTNATHVSFEHSVRKETPCGCALAFPAGVTDPLLLFIGCYQIPMYVTILLWRLYRQAKFLARAALRIDRRSFQLRNPLPCSPGGQGKWGGPAS